MSSIAGALCAVCEALRGREFPSEDQMLRTRARSAVVVGFCLLLAGTAQVLSGETAAEAPSRFYAVRQIPPTPLPLFVLPV